LNPKDTQCRTSLSFASLDKLDLFSVPRRPAQCSDAAASISAVSQECNRDLSVRTRVQRQGAATPYRFVVHMRSENKDTLRAGPPHRC
jgi:hypothetical protein